MANWCVKSPSDDRYQCIAWAACRTDALMWPHEWYKWFPGLPLVEIDVEAPVDYFVQGFAVLGYRPCESRAFEFGYQKVAIYRSDQGVTHMARQEFFGRGWLSKLGIDGVDIFHEQLEDVAGSMSPMAGQYGMVAQVLKRSWWSALIDLSLFKCIWFALRFRLYRLWQLVANAVRPVLEVFKAFK